MLEKLSFNNYKSFSEGEIKIKPITILLGANSVGKSSILQLFLMLQQTALSEKNYKSPLKLHGGFVSMGEGLNLIRKKDHTKVLKIKLDFKSENLFDELKNLGGAFYREVISTIQLFKVVADPKNSQTDIPMKEFEKIFSKNLYSSNLDVLSKKVFRESFHDSINDFSKELQKLDLDKIKLKDENFNRYFYMLNSIGRARSYLKVYKEKDKLNSIRMLKFNHKEYLLTFDYLTGISRELINGQFSVEYELASKDKTLFLKSFSLYNEQNKIIKLEFAHPNQNKLDLKLVTSKYIVTKDLDSSIFKNVQKIFGNQKTIFSFVNNIEEMSVIGENNSPLSQTLRSIIASINSVTSDHFDDDSINYVSPLRAHPKRYYFLDKAKINMYLDTLDGDAIAEILKENAPLKRQVNTWLEKFNLKVNVEHLEDIIHRLQVNQNSLDLDITDVGFGISQILPVIIQGFLSHNGTLTLIEQPEIHLHPKMQADLADLFIEIVFANKKKPSKYLVIETHSEYLLKRLRRRISENAISAEDVAIYLIDPDIDQQGATIKELKVHQRGQFEWPVDFYGGELLRDTTEFLKNQID